MCSPAAPGAAPARWNLGSGESGDEVVRHAGAERSPPQVARAEHRLGPRLPPGQGRLVRLSHQREWVAILDEGRHLAEADVGGERRIRRPRAGLVDVAQPTMLRNRVEDQLGATTRQGGLIADVERGDEVGESLSGDTGSEVGRPLGERAAPIRTSGDLPGDR